MRDPSPRPILHWSRQVGKRFKAEERKARPGRMGVSAPVGRFGRLGHAAAVKRRQFGGSHWTESGITAKRHLALGLRTTWRRYLLPHRARMQQGQPVALAEMIHRHCRFRIAQSRKDRSGIKMRCGASKYESSRTQRHCTYDTKRNEPGHRKSPKRTAATDPAEQTPKAPRLSTTPATQRVSVGSVPIGPNAHQFVITGASRSGLNDAGTRAQHREERKPSPRFDVAARPSFPPPPVLGRQCWAQPICRSAAPFLSASP